MNSVFEGNAFLSPKECACSINERKAFIGWCVAEYEQAQGAAVNGQDGE